MKKEHATYWEERCCDCDELVEECACSDDRDDEEEKMSVCFSHRWMHSPMDPRFEICASCGAVQMAQQMEVKP